MVVYAVVYNHEITGDSSPVAIFNIREAAQQFADQQERDDWGSWNVYEYEVL